MTGDGAAARGRARPLSAGPFAAIRLAFAGSRRLALGAWRRSPDTIAALATPAGTSALAVIRVTGPDTERLARGLVGSRSPAPRGPAQPTIATGTASWSTRSSSLSFPSPAPRPASTSSRFLPRQSLHRPANPRGSLRPRAAARPSPANSRKRAFLNGKMDLSQAEAVMDLISARSERALAAAHRQLRGVARPASRAARRAAARRARDGGGLHRLSRRGSARGKPRGAPRGDRRRSGRRRRLLATRRYGDLLARRNQDRHRRRDQRRKELAPQPARSDSERAIVSPEPGTTRDFIEERALVGPHCLRLIDTAGLNPAPGTVERLGDRKDARMYRRGGYDRFRPGRDPPHPAARSEDRRAPDGGADDSGVEQGRSFARCERFGEKDAAAALYPGLTVGARVGAHGCRHRRAQVRDDPPGGFVRAFGRRGCGRGQRPPRPRACHGRRLPRAIPCKARGKRAGRSSSPAICAAPWTHLGRFRERSTTSGCSTVCFRRFASGNKRVRGLRLSGGGLPDFVGCRQTRNSRQYRSPLPAVTAGKTATKRRLIRRQLLIRATRRLSRPPPTASRSCKRWIRPYSSLCRYHALWPSYRLYPTY